MVKLASFVQSLIMRLHNDVDGQGLAEYALIMALVVLAAVGTMRPLAAEINSAFSQITSTLQNAMAT